jgi:YesN/AraC family two-component response regulator
MYTTENEIISKDKKSLIQQVELLKNRIEALREINEEQREIIKQLNEKVQRNELSQLRLNQELEAKVKSITKKKIFLRSNISLTSIAKEIGTNRTYLSIYINTNYGSFYNFINTHRIKEACIIIEKEVNVVLKTLYCRVGYKSQNTFYKAFKEITNSTPRKYLLSVKK